LFLQKIQNRLLKTEKKIIIGKVVVDCEANLDGLESIDVGLDHAVSQICRLRGVLLTAVVYDAGVMDVHRGVAGVMNKAVEEAKFELKIVFPYAADGDPRRPRRHGSATVI